MIDDVDRALANFLTSAVTEPGSSETVEVTFDVPTAAWAATVTAPTIDLFLRHILENRDGKVADWVGERDESGTVIGVRPPLRRYELSYLVSAWGGSVQDQHRLLGLVLAAMPVYDDLPSQHLVGRLAASGLSVGLRLADATSSVELWTSLGQPFHPAIELVVTAPVLATLVTDLAPTPTSIDIGLAAAAGRRGRSPVPALPDAPGSAPVKHRVPPSVDTADEQAPSEEPDAQPGWTTFRIRESGPGSRS